MSAFYVLLCLLLLDALVIFQYNVIFELLMKGRPPLPEAKLSVTCKEVDFLYSSKHSVGFKRTPYSYINTLNLWVNLTNSVYFLKFQLGLHSIHKHLRYVHQQLLYCNYCCKSNWFQIFVTGTYNYIFLSRLSFMNIQITNISSYCETRATIKPNVKQKQYYCINANEHTVVMIYSLANLWYCFSKEKSSLILFSDKTNWTAYNKGI